LTCEIRKHTSCSTHIHLGFESGWPLELLKKIAKLWLWLEEAIRDSVPEERRDSIWARPNCGVEYDERFPAAREMVKLYQDAINGVDSFNPLFQFVDEADDLAALIERVAPERCLSWNLQHTRAQCGTIEFRRAPQSGNKMECLHWVTFVLSIVGLAMDTDFDPEDRPDDRKGLESTLKEEAEKLNIGRFLKQFESMATTGSVKLTPYEALSIFTKKMEKDNLKEEEVKQMNEKVGNKY
jgi:hypothetical protein